MRLEIGFREAAIVIAEHEINYDNIFARISHFRDGHLFRIGDEV